MGIDPETVRLVAQCLNHYATPGPDAEEKQGIINHVLCICWILKD